MSARWDCLDDVGFVLQEPPKSKRVSKLSIRQLFPSTRPPGYEIRTSERSRDRVSVRYSRNHAPTLHLRLSEFDINPIMKTLYSLPRSPSSLHLISETSSTGSYIGTATTGNTDTWNPHHRNAPSDAPTSPPMFVQPTPEVYSSVDRTTGPSPADGEYKDPFTHSRGDTASSTLSHLQLDDVMTLSESPPDPGFVLPIPSRSRARRRFEPPRLDDLKSTHGPVSAQTPVNNVHYTRRGYDQY